MPFWGLLISDYCFTFLLLCHKVWEQHVGVPASREQRDTRTPARLMDTNTPQLRFWFCAPLVFDEFSSHFSRLPFSFPWENSNDLSDSISGVNLIVQPRLWGRYLDVWSFCLRFVYQSQIFFTWQFLTTWQVLGVILGTCPLIIAATPSRSVLWDRACSPLLQWGSTCKEMEGPGTDQTYGEDGAKIPNKDLWLWTCSSLHRCRRQSVSSLSFSGVQWRWRMSATLVRCCIFHVLGYSMLSTVSLASKHICVSGHGGGANETVEWNMLISDDSLSDSGYAINPDFF